MFSSRQYVKGIEAVPDTWLFKYYLNLPETLTGQLVRINSIFNENDKTPSMFLYVDKYEKKYVFKCHSSGRFGGGVALVQALFNLNFKDACAKIVNDYYTFCKDGEYQKVTVQAVNLKWIVENEVVRPWTKGDAKFWLQYNIGSSLLGTYNVLPLASYTLTQVDGDTGQIVKSYYYESQSCYGYYSNGSIYKIYNPKSKTQKFLTLDKYLQGTDQLQNHKTLVIASSLKDIMSIKSLGLTIDCIAPSSESAKLRKEEIELYKEKYEHVVVCMDSDTAGIASMKYYEETYGLPFLYLPREKDISDIIKVHGKEVALHDFYPKLQAAIEKYIDKKM